MKKLLSVFAFLLPAFATKAQVKPVEIKKQPQSKVLPKDVKESEINVTAGLDSMKMTKIKEGVYEKQYKDATKTVKMVNKVSK